MKDDTPTAVMSAEIRGASSPACKLPGRWSYLRAQSELLQRLQQEATEDENRDEEKGGVGSYHKDVAMGKIDEPQDTVPLCIR